MPAIKGVTRARRVYCPACDRPFVRTRSTRSTHTARKFKCPFCKETGSISQLKKGWHSIRGVEVYK